jgi:hypothetical protein
MSDFESYEIEMRDSQGVTHPATIRLIDSEYGKCKLELLLGERSLSATASDFFEAFCQIRLALEAEGILPICYAASLNVFPSGMCRDMGAGLKAYKHTIGQRGRWPDLVDIFATCDDVVPATVAEQATFHDRWIGSWQNTPAT